MARHAATTLDFRGERSIPIKTSGHEKVTCTIPFLVLHTTSLCVNVQDRFTVALAALADGTKLTPFIIFKGKRRNKEADKVQGVVIEYSHNGWMTEETALRWITVVWRRRYDDKRRLFSWDSYKCHLTNPVKSALSQRNTDVVVVPGGTTSLIQVSKLMTKSCLIMYWLCYFRQLMFAGISHLSPIIRPYMMTGWQMGQKHTQKGATSELQRNDKCVSGC